MPYPQPPEIQTSYTAQEQALGDGTLPGQELDVDLASVRASVTAIIEFLKTSIRSDGRLANGSVSSDTLASSLIIGFDPPQVWATGTDYTTRSTVFEGFGFYLCTQAHTSGVFASDLASDRWALLADLTPPGGALVASNNLSDLPDKAVARSNLQLGTMATANSGTGAAQFRTNLQNEAFFQPLASALTAWAAITRAANFDAFVASPTSANLRALLTDETGSGAALFAGGAMGTPASLVLTNATGLPLSGILASDIVTASETIAANNNDTTVPTSAAVKAYADAKPLQQFFQSAEQTITNAGSLTIAHGLSAVPKLLQAVLVCKTAEFGYSVNDEVLIIPHGFGDLSARGISVVPDATNLNVRYGANGFGILNRTTGTSNTPTNGSWRLVLRVWA